MVGLVFVVDFDFDDVEVFFEFLDLVCEFV